MSNGHAIPSGFMVTREELQQYVNEQTQNIMDTMRVVNALKEAVNKQAMALALNRFVIERFVPGPLLERAVKEFNEQVTAQIAAEEANAQGQVH